MKTSCISLVCVLALTGSLAQLAGADPAAKQPPGYSRLNETPEQRDARMTWWRKAKFGMFIHWGVYAVPAGTYQGKQIGGIGEWIMRRAEIPVAEYKAFAKEFDPVRYDPDAWAALAQEAGMKYIVITSKHHDGFALFPSDVTDWDVADATPYGKDLIGPLAKAARDHGLHFGLYYSQAQDWNHPGGAKAGLNEGQGWDAAHRGDFDTYLQTIAYPQVKEILTRYQPDILWWDTPTWMNKQRADRLRPLLRLQPAIIVNNRLGGGYQGDTDTPEQHIPATGIPGRDWEVCMTMNNTWGYKSYDHDWKSVEDLIHKLADIVSKGGNFLLNVGPKADGTIPQESIDRLKAVGKWMQVNGNAIYDTTASPFPTLPWGRCTKRLHEGGATLYLHVFDWPADGNLLVPGLRNRVTSAKLLAGGGTLPSETVEEGVRVRLPAQAPDAIDSIVQLEVTGELNVAKLLPKQAADGSLTLTAQQADIHNVSSSQVQVESKYGVPNIGYWIEPRVKISWQFRVSQPGPFAVVADLATPAENVGFHVQLDGQSFAARAQRTGDYSKFVRQTLGQLIIDAGEHELTIEPDRDHWQPINLRSVTLEPVRPQETAQQREQRMQWWREARFGMFVHWGLYAIPAGEWDGKVWESGGMEWIQRIANVPADVYQQRLLPQFKPKPDFATEWATLARDAGCKYVVFTNKHHEGFALHDSAVTSFDAKDVTGRDLHQEIVNAVRWAGLKVGAYHSLWDWHHPHAYAGPGSNNPPCQTMEGRDPRIYVDYLHNQVNEIVTKYGPLDVLWCDYSSPEIQGESWGANELIAMVRQRQPQIILNNRLYRSPQAGWHDDHHLEPFDNRFGDFCTPEQRIPPTGVPGVDWETCMTINTTWGYSKHDHAWKSSETLIRNLVDIASKGGNYLLNIGPMADGSVPTEIVQRMRQIGQWMAINGESIYGTSASPFADLSWGRCTKKVHAAGTTLYLHIFDWPAEGRLLVSELKGGVKSARLLKGGQPVAVTSGDEGTVLQLPSEAPDTPVSVVVVEVGGEWASSR